jgi:hypothetical protein
MLKITNPQYTNNLSKTKTSGFKILKNDTENEPVYVYGCTEENGIN